MVKKKTSTSPRKVSAGKSAAKKKAAKKVVAKKASVSKKTGKTKAAPKKATSKKVVATKAGRAKPVTKKTAAKKAAQAKVTETKAVAKTVKKAAPKRKRRGRITKMTVQETLISLTSLEGGWAEFEWLHGLILYGPGLRRVAVHREFSFMVVYRGLRNPAQLRQAKVDLDKRIRAAVPVKRHLHFVTDFDILRRVEADDPAFIAVLGHAITIYARASS